jgi:hypothetical protein
LIWTAAARTAAGRKRFKPQIFTDETQIEKSSVPICAHLWLIPPFEPAEKLDDDLNLPQTIR